jgi:hypothetical protein
MGDYPEPLSQHAERFGVVRNDHHGLLHC